MSKTNGHHWSKLYFKDWHDSQALMLSSMTARGVCIEAEMLMSRSPVPGAMLLETGKPITAAMLAQLCQGDPAQVESGLRELVENGEFEFIDGVYWCERVRHQMTVSGKRREAVNTRYNSKTVSSTKRRTNVPTRSVSVSVSDSSKEAKRTLDVLTHNAQRTTRKVI